MHVRLSYFSQGASPVACELECYVSPFHISRIYWYQPYVSMHEESTVKNFIKVFTIISDINIT